MKIAFALLVIMAMVAVSLSMPNIPNQSGGYAHSRHNTKIFTVARIPRSRRDRFRYVCPSTPAENRRGELKLVDDRAENKLEKVLDDKRSRVTSCAFMAGAVIVHQWTISMGAGFYQMNLHDALYPLRHALECTRPRLMRLSCRSGRPRPNSPRARQ